MLEGHELKIVMHVTSGGTIPAFNGHLVRGAFFSLLKQTVPELTDHLHRDNHVRPYSISSFRKHGKVPKKLKNGLFLRAGDQGTITLRMVTTELARQAVKSLLEVTNTELSLGPEVKAIISHVNYRMTRLPSLDDLPEPPINSEQPHAFSLKFLSPTQFVSRETNHPVVLPELPQLLRNVLTHWEHLARSDSLTGRHHAAENEPASSPSTSESREHAEFLDRIRQGVVVIAHDIHTQRIDIGKPVWFVGFKGWVQWKTLPEFLEPRDLTWLWNLLTLGEFLGVGKHRTAGFGWYRIDKVSWIDNKEERN